MTREEENRKQRERRKRNGNSVTRKYEKTINGFLMRLYRNMESRTSGIQKQKYHLYKNKFLLDREIFYEWAKSSEEFKIMFKMWEDSNYERKLTPTVDRENSELGYTLDNMRWLTHSENSRLGSISRNKIHGNPSTVKRLEREKQIT